jgi:hypothetical protein
MCLCACVCVCSCERRLLFFYACLINRRRNASANFQRVRILYLESWRRLHDKHTARGALRPLCQSSVHHKEKQSSMCLSLFLRHRFRTQSRRMSCSSVTLCSTQQIMASASPTVPLGLRPTGNSHLTQADMILCCVERSRAIRRMGRPEPQHLLCISGARRVQVESSVAYFAHFCKPRTFPRPDIHRRLPHCWSALRI